VNPLLGHGCRARENDWDPIRGLQDGALIELDGDIGAVTILDVAPAHAATAA
jgi:hypothetical protein